MSSKTVVIVGGSTAGIGVAKALIKDSPGVKVILINPSDKYYFNLAAPRLLVKPNSLSPDKYLYPMTSIFKGISKDSFEFVQGTVHRIDPSSKTVSTSDKTIPYDYLVIASGSSSRAPPGTGAFAPPFKPTGVDANTFQAQVKTAQETISRAQSIIIGGAGPLGVEIAGELADISKDKKITIITPSSRVLPMLKEGPSSVAEKLLAKKNVSIVKGSSVVGVSQQGTQWAVQLNTGKEMTADLYIATTGASPNNSFIPQEFLVDGWVNVDSYLRVCAPNSKAPEPEGVYALGDITIHTPRTSIKANEQVPVVAANIRAAIEGSSRLKPYTGAQGGITMVVPIGEDAGTGQMFGWTVWGKLVSWVKGKDFLTSRAPGMLGIRQ